MAIEAFVAKAVEVIEKKSESSKSRLETLFEKESVNEGKIKDVGSFKPDVETIKVSSIQQIVEENKEKLMDVRKAIAQEEGTENSDSGAQEGTNENGEKKGLSEEEKAKIKELTGWSDEILDAIGSMEEAEIYMKAGLKEVEINGKKCLIREDIDWNQKDEMGRTNKERAEQGLSPITKDGKTVELHHIGQHADSPLAELTTEEHRGKGNDTVLHDKTKESEIDRRAFANERSSHWEARAQEGGNV